MRELSIVLPANGRHWRDVDLADFQIHPEMSGCGIEKADHMRTQQRLRDPLALQMNMAKPQSQRQRLVDAFLRHLSLARAMIFSADSIRAQ